MHDTSNLPPEPFENWFTNQEVECARPVTSLNCASSTAVKTNSAPATIQAIETRHQPNQRRGGRNQKESIMRNLVLALTASASLAGGMAAVFPAEAAPAPALFSGVYDPATPPALEKAQWFWGGRNYCWYDGGWSGPGYYWCGYAWRRGYGWGGGYGWHRWGGGHPYAYYHGGGYRGGGDWHGGGDYHHGGDYHGGDYHGGGDHHGGGGDHHGDGGDHHGDGGDHHGGEGDHHGGEGDHGPR
jgi:hypothetical protein